MFKGSGKVEEIEGRLKKLECDHEDTDFTEGFNCPREVCRVCGKVLRYFQSPFEYEQAKLASLGARKEVQEGVVSGMQEGWGQRKSNWRRLERGSQRVFMYEALNRLDALEVAVNKLTAKR